jgi:hypothetical protein
LQLTNVFTTRFKKYMEEKTRARDRKEKGVTAHEARFDGIASPLLVSYHGIVVQLPRDLALSLLRRRKATLIANPRIVAELVLTESDLEDAGLDLWANEPMAAA